MMSARPACHQCRFWDDKLCRINPPQLPHFPIPGEDVTPEIGLWPVVSGDEWCGHFSWRLDPEEL